MIFVHKGYTNEQVPLGKYHGIFLQSPLSVESMLTKQFPLGEYPLIYLSIEATLMIRFH